MADQVQLRRGTTAEVAAFTGAQGEIVVDTDTNQLAVQDGVTAGGHKTATDLSAARGSCFEEDGSTTANTYVVVTKTGFPVLSNLIGGEIVRFLPSIANTAACTVNSAQFSGGPFSIKLSDGTSDPIANDIAAGAECILINRTTHFELLNPQTKVVSSFAGFSGLVTSNGADALHDINIATGRCADQSGAVMMQLLSPLTKQIDANWAEGSNLGGFPSGLSLTADTFYTFFLIAKPDGTVDCGWDTSPTASNLLADATEYAYYREIAAHLTDGSADITPYLQRANRFVLDEPVRFFVVTGGGSTTGAAITAICPPNKLAMLSANATDANANTVYFSEIAQTNVAPTTQNCQLRLEGADGHETNDFEIHVDSNSDIRYRVDNNITLNVISRGWIDDRES